jgi:hypothetical protein
MDDTQLVELIKALLRLSHAVNDLSQELLERSGVDESAAVNENVAQAAYLLRTALQALDAALEFRQHRQLGDQ